MKRFLPLIIVTIGLVVIYITGAYEYLSFEFLQENHKALKDFIIEHPFLTPCLFILLYTALTALSAPGGIFLTLLGGYLFSQPLSTIYVLFSATLGGSLIFMIARMSLGAVLEKKAAPFIKKMRQGFKKNAASYLLFLRFVPLFPFWAVNLAPAFLGVPLRTFIWTTAVGIIPGTVALTLAGGGLEKAFSSEKPFSLDVVFNVELKVALILLGILSLIPIIIKRMKKS